MFIFRSKRTSLCKRLWKARVKRELQDEARGETKTSAKEHPPSEDPEIETERTLRNEILKRLQEDQLETLTLAVESGDNCESPCVLLPVGLVNEPQVMCCQIWRWPDLRMPNEMKPFPYCKTRIDSSVICCNPYHWSRLLHPETPPPPYRRFAEETIKPEDRAPSEVSTTEDRRNDQLGSVATSGEPPGPEWCRLAYWEMCTRVGRQFYVIPPTVDVFWSGPKCNGLCLESMAAENASPPEAVIRARTKIGKGLTLSQESDGVWAYNRSEVPLFISSPTLDNVSVNSLLVCRLPPGHCLNVYVHGAPIKFKNPIIGPFDRFSVRISFTKGWGPGYTRQAVICCPTWIEILLAPYR